ncbi:unnamed protein product, partial [Ascophyllum nodosum]
DRGNATTTRHLSCPRCRRLLIVPRAETFRCQCSMIFRVTGSSDNQLHLCFSLRDQEANGQGFGLPRELVERMPAISVTQQMVDGWESAKAASAGEKVKEESLDTDNMACRICLHDYKDGDSVRVLPCFHRFHVDEIDDWLDRNSSCPLCHLDICEALTGTSGVAFLSTVGGNPTPVIERSTGR